MNGPESSEQQQLREEISNLKRQLAARDEKVGLLTEMVKRGAREMRAGGKDLLADLEAVLKS